jgi:peptidoglycan/LPS O-acetylase OafA/YrhL
LRPGIGSDDAGERCTPLECASEERAEPARNRFLLRPLTLIRKDVHVTSRRNPSIDVARGLSALLVVAAHLPIIDLPTGTAERHFLLSVFRNGFYGVSIFFAISGFLITSNIIARSGTFREISLARFYRYRAARIGPLLVAVLIALCLLAYSGLASFAVGPPYDLVKMVLAALTFRYNDYQARVGSPSLAWGILWSLSVEEMFYLIYPLLCIVIGNKVGIASVLMIVVVASFASALSGFSVVSTSACSGQLAMGALAALIVANQNWHAALRPHGLWLKILGASIALLTNWSTASGVYGPPAMVGLILAAVFLVSRTLSRFYVEPLNLKLRNALSVPRH